MTYALYGRNMTVTLLSSRKEDARFYVRWSYYWTKGPRKSIERLNWISYYSEITIPLSQITE